MYYMWRCVVFKMFRSLSHTWWNVLKLPIVFYAVKKETNKQKIKNKFALRTVLFNLFIDFNVETVAVLKLIRNFFLGRKTEILEQLGKDTFAIFTPKNRFTYKGFHYQLEKIRKNRRYCHCTNSKTNGCEARIVIKTEDNTDHYVQYREHNHDVEPMDGT